MRFWVVLLGVLALKANGMRLCQLGFVNDSSVVCTVNTSQIKNTLMECPVCMNWKKEGCPVFEEFQLKRRRYYNMSIAIPDSPVDMGYITFSCNKDVIGQLNFSTLGGATREKVVFNESFSGRFLINESLKMVLEKQYNDYVYWIRILDFNPRYRYNESFMDKGNNRPMIGLPEMTWDSVKRDYLPRKGTTSNKSTYRPGPSDEVRRCLLI